MKHQILVLHFGAQCPWHQWVIEQARRAAQQLRAEVVIKDVTDHPKLAEQYKMFFPSMTVIDETIRVPPPVGAEKLVQMAKETAEPKPTSPMAYGKRAGRCVIQALTPNNIEATIPLCIAGVEPIAAREKARWAKEMLKKSGCPLPTFFHEHGFVELGKVDRVDLANLGEEELILMGKKL